MRHASEPDVLDELIAESEETTPGFTAKVESALRRRVLGRALASRRAAMRLTQVELARRMGTSPGAVRRLERGENVRNSTLTRYLNLVGLPDDWPDFVPAGT